MEIALCLYGRKKPAFVFVVVPKEVVVSKMVLGCTSKHFIFSYCNSFEEIPDLFEKVVKAHFKHR